MKILCVLVAVLAVTLAAEGCKRRETKPAPQVGNPLPIVAADRYGASRG